MIRSFIFNFLLQVAFNFLSLILDIYAFVNSIKDSMFKQAFFLTKGFKCAWILYRELQVY